MRGTGSDAGRFRWWFPTPHKSLQTVWFALCTDETYIYKRMDWLDRDKEEPMPTPRNWQRLLGLLVVILAVSGVVQGSDLKSRFDDVDSRLGQLREVANGFPPRVADVEARRAAEELWRGLVQDLNNLLLQVSDKYAVEFRLAECYRMGYNLDLPNSGSLTEKHFLRAIDLRPNDIRPRMWLGHHLAYGGSEVKAERVLREAISLVSGDPPYMVCRDLTSALYFQQKFAESAEWATKCLQRNSGDPSMKLILEQSKSVLAGGPVPGRVDIEMPNPDKIVECPGGEESDGFVYRNIGCSGSR